MVPAVTMVEATAIANRCSDAHFMAAADHDGDDVGEEEAGFIIEK